MRVIAGQVHGRRLKAPRGMATRPTSARVRESIFSRLAARLDFDGLKVLDIFAGSGALGIEALSRGAASAVFVERDARAAGAIRANLGELGLGDDEAIVVQAPLSAALRTARERGDAYDLVFLDPPYRLAPALGMELTESLAPLLAARARIVTESDRRAPLDLPLPATHERRYGDTLIRIHQE